jgi:hypothetical protein
MAQHDLGCRRKRFLGQPTVLVRHDLITLSHQLFFPPSVGLRNELGKQSTPGGSSFLSQLIDNPD